MAEVLKGPCADCGLPMVDQREWQRNTRVRPGRVKYGGLGHCQACYVRGRRHGTLPKVPTVSVVATRYVVRCERCGLVGEVGDRAEADRIRGGHLVDHGVKPASLLLRDGEPLARRFRSGECQAERHAPACDGYYPPGVDTFRCLCACHGPLPNHGGGP